MHKGKKYVDSAKTIDRSKLYDPAEALAAVVSTAKAKFDETVELHVKLGVDSRHADQQVRGAIVLPHGTGKNVRVLCSLRVPRLTKRWLPARTMSAQRICSSASRRKTSLTTT